VPAHSPIPYFPPPSREGGGEPQKTGVKRTDSVHSGGFFPIGRSQVESSAKQRHQREARPGKEASGMAFAMNILTMRRKGQRRSLSYDFWDVTHAYARGEGGQRKEGP